VRHGSISPIVDQPEKSKLSQRILVCNSEARAAVQFRLAVPMSLRTTERVRLCMRASDRTKIGRLTGPEEASPFLV
jgi:hypothetical protein